MYAYVNVTAEYCQPLCGGHGNASLAYLMFAGRWRVWQHLCLRSNGRDQAEPKVSLHWSCESIGIMGL